MSVIGSLGVGIWVGVIRVGIQIGILKVTGRCHVHVGVSHLHVNLDHFLLARDRASLVVASLTLDEV